MAKSPVAILFTTDGVEAGVKDGIAVPTDARGYISVGYDGTNTRFIRVDTSGRLIAVGAGVAGTPAGGVVSVQGVAGGTVLPISVASLPLPTGAATETTLASRLAEATFTARINTLGQKAMAASTPVVIASDQTVIPVSDNGGSLTVDTPQLPAALAGGRLDTNVGSWFGAATPTVGQKAMASSLPVTFASDQTALPASQSGTWTVQQGTPPWQVVGPGAAGVAVTGNPVMAGGSDGTNARYLSTDTAGRLVIVQGTPSLLNATVTQGPAASLANNWPVKVTDGTNSLPTMDVAARAGFVRWTDGTNTAAVKAASTAAVAADPSGVVALSPNSPLPAGTNNIGDVDILTVPAPLSTTGGGTEATALRVTIANDSTGVVSVDDNGGSLTVDTPQLPAVLVGGRLDENVGAWLGSTAPTVGQKTMANSVPVVLASDQTSINTKLNSTTAAVTQVVSSATNVTLLASNTARRGASIYNDSVKKLYVKLGATASLTSYTKQLDVDEYWEIPFGYTGQIDGLWTLANGNAYVTELT